MISKHLVDDWNNPLLQTIALTTLIFTLAAIDGYYTKLKNYRGGRSGRRRRPL